MKLLFLSLLFLFNTSAAQTPAVKVPVKPVQAKQLKLTPLQITQIAYIAGVLAPVLQTNNPNADPNSVTLLSNELATYYITVILPNLQVDLTTGLVTFVVPGGS